ncbi:hypothetical protein HMI55_001568 [Coelomomyces lativittatus]|nr:hypothetical protein HMI55_001568 [Coelomomyces lativittatus]
MSSHLPSVQRIRMLATQVGGGANGASGRSFFTKSMIGLSALAGIGIGTYQTFFLKEFSIISLFLLCISVLLFSIAT